MSIGPSWSKVLERVAASKPATEAVVAYLLSFYGKKEGSGELIALLEKYLPLLTPSTLWLL
jgi:hypothetical protein